MNDNLIYYRKQFNRYSRLIDLNYRIANSRIEQGHLGVAEFYQQLAATCYVHMVETKALFDSDIPVSDIPVSDIKYRCTHCGEIAPRHHINCLTLLNE